MKLTYDLIEDGKSRNGGWSYKQIQTLGEDHSRKGWLDRLIGQEVSHLAYARFLSLKDMHLNKKKHKFAQKLEEIEGWLDSNAVEAEGVMCVEVDVLLDYLKDFT